MNDVFEKQKNKIFWQSTTLLVLMFLAFSRWIPGNDLLNPEEGTRGWIEVGFMTFSLFLAVAFWGIKKFAVGLKIPSFNFLALFCLWAMITSIWAPNHLLSLGKAGSLISLTFLTIIIAYQTVRFGISIVKVVLSALIILVSILFLINLISFHSLLPIDWSAVRPRLTLAFNHPNTTATYFSTIIICSFFLLGKTRNISSKYYYALSIILFSIMLYLTNSRTTIIALIITIFLIYTFQIRSLHIKTILISFGGFLAFFALILFLTGFFDKIFIQYFGITDFFDTISGRLRLWNDVLNNLPNINIGGVGYYGSRFILTPDIAWATHAHNAFLEIFSTTGFIGLILVIFFFLSTYTIFIYPSTFFPALIYLLYASLESLMETKLFSPSIIMAVTCLFVFYQQFGIHFYPSLIKHIPPSDYEPI